MVKMQPTGWVGWIYFASVLMMLSGGLQIIAGLTGIFNGNYYVATQTGDLLVFNYATWGWVHLLFGIGILAAAIGIMAGSVWARVVAIMLVVLAALEHIVFLSAYPLWAIILLIIDGLVIYALTMHGDELNS
jgi:hypothetical protein